MTAIVQLSRGFETWAWLCPKHVKERIAEGWEVVKRKQPPHELPCDACREAPPFSAPARAESTRGATKVGSGSAGRKLSRGAL